MLDVRFPDQRARNLALIAGLIAATIIPMAIHTVMLDDLRIPYPSSYPKTGWPVIPDRIVLMAELSLLACEIAKEAEAPRFLKPFWLTFILSAAINQDLFRTGIMRNSVSTKWTIYPFIDNLPVLLLMAIIASLIVLLTRMSRRCILAPACVALAFVYELLKTETNHLFSGLLKATASLEGDTKFFVPYDWHVNLPSYLSYAEPVLGACGVAALYSRHHHRRSRAALLSACTIFAIGGGPLFKPLLNIYFAAPPPMLAFLSSAQFTFESAALAVMVACFWTYLAPRRGRGPGAITLASE